MSCMKKTIYLSIIFIAILTLFAAQAVFAGDPPAAASTLRKSLDTAATEPGLIPTSGVTDIPSMVGKIVSVALQFVSLLFLIIIVYAGIRWMTANGDPGKVKEARSWMIHAAIGLLITLMSYQVVAYIIDKIVIQ
ncbi:MAG: hypothetical protein UT32_C0002G0046 [Parcubacteria group bacterium GW2011_GWC2_39_14]|nr:MAG: hypothetical protein UT32_C0002G0046 [Parcubacteria group bacterium GW2011_GWC2_39_14]KKR55271.1 MAG: hypothetical protein UT91_C0003G0046 [Parcubacteria group bacterium GW2011_GWA2_40_23]